MSKETTYVALLRGINVGGNNLIKMADLKTCFEREGFKDVSTYIQSGNVVFTAASSESATLTRKIERALTTRFGYRATIVVRSVKEMKGIVERAPAGFGEQPALYRYDVIFLMEPLTPLAALKSVPVKEGVDEVHAGESVLYFSRLVSRATQSRLAKVASLPIYQSLTLRNWNTTTKLARLMGAVPE